MSEVVVLGATDAKLGETFCKCDHDGTRKKKRNNGQQRATSDTD